MATVDQLIAARDELKLARLRGVREVRDADGSAVTYKSDSEMAAALAAVEREIVGLTGKPAPRTVIFRTSKGL